MKYLLGIDVSTTASKALIVDDHGTVVAAKSTPHRISSPHPLWSEQEPEEWWLATVSSIQAALHESGIDAGRIAGVGLTGQMHGLVLLDATGNVLRPAMLWNDQRAGAECDSIRDTIGLERLVKITGNDAFAGFTAPKLLWVKNNEPATYNKTAHVLLPKDYVRYRLTGGFATDKAGAGGTLLLDLKARDWSHEILDALDIDSKWLPKTFEGPSTTGYVSETAAAETGLDTTTPVVGGGGDQAAQAVGVGSVTPDIWGLTIGTSGVVFAPCNAPVTENLGRVHAFPHAAPDLWHLMGVMLSAGGSLAWYHDTFAHDLQYDDLIAEAERIEAGCEGVVFQPYLTGERTPHSDPDLRGSFIGLAARHSRGHFTRSVLEGVAYGLRDNFELLKGVGLPIPKQVRLSGGGSQSQVWRQIIADVLGLELVTVQTTEGAAYGAALLAGVGSGVWSDVRTACEETVRIDSVVTPNQSLRKRYDETYDRFKSLYPILSPLYHAGK